MGIARTTRAFFYAAGVFFKRQPSVLILLVVGVASVVGAFVALIHPNGFVVTPEELQARADMAQRQEAHRRAENERRKVLCTVKKRCEKYGTVRQECATAGSYQNCVRIKMGSADFELIDSCTEDGKPAGVADSEIPDPVTCFASGL
jgi:hypothetical protein